jgi:hypothetical protein
LWLTRAMLHPCPCRSATWRSHLHQLTATNDHARGAEPLGSATRECLLAADFIEKLIVIQPIKKLPTSYEPKGLLPSSQKLNHWSLSWVWSMQSVHSHSTSLRSILILSFY